ncbi:MAG: SPASM domain-containing protein [Candidatus Omnitrophica bacterium]|nr:SPASM domain-containing protein [Candidatus Omnitrophota bacterium]
MGLVNFYVERGWLRRKAAWVRELWQRGFDWRFLVYRAKFNWSHRLDRPGRFPAHLDIETTDACNLRCVMCVQGIGEGVQNTGMIDMDFAKRLIDQGATHGLYSIKFNWRGEPALHAGLVELVRYAKSRGILEVQFNTNGIPYTESKIRELVLSGLDRIIFSMDGATKATYEKIRVGSDYDKLVENVKRFHAIRTELKRERPFIRIQMVRMKDNQHEVDQFIAMWKPFVDDIRVDDVSNRGQGNQMSVGDWVSTGRKRCPQPWQRMIVSRDGKVLPCCADWNREFIIGDATKEPLTQIWRGKRMEMMRQVQRDIRLNEIDPCRYCYVKESYTWQRMDRQVPPAAPPNPPGEPILEPAAHATPVAAC